MSMMSIIRSLSCMAFGSVDNSTDPHDMAVETVSLLVDISRSNGASNQQTDSPYS